MSARHAPRAHRARNAANEARRRPTYTLLDVLQASATQPLPQAKRTHQLTRMWQGLRALEQAAAPTPDDWRVVSDAVNLLETLVDTLRVAQDASGLLPDAVRALALAGARHVDEGKPLRLTGADIPVLRAVLEDYAALLDALPARTMVRAHLLTERRIWDVLDGRGRAHDVRVVGV